MKPILLFLSAMLCAAPLAAQERPVDEGTLLVFRNGDQVGRESFRILRATAAHGQAYRATALGSIGPERIQMGLNVDSLGAPISYDVEVKVRGEVHEHLQATARPGRFSALSQTAHGSAASDYLMGTNPLVLDVEAFHQYYFAALLPRRTQFSVLEPRTGTQMNLRLEDRGDEPLRIGRQTTTARHLALVGPDGATRDFWVDAANHLLKVAIPASGWVAERDELPPR